MRHPIHTPGKSAAAFTLIELLAVIVVIGILAAIIIPVVSDVRDRAQLTQCVSNLRQIHAGFELYAPEHQNTYPRFYSDGEGGDQTWMAKLAPYVGMVDGYIGSDFKTQQRSAGIFICPSYDPEKVAARRVSYACNGYLKRDPWNYRRAVIPEPAKTIIVGEIDRNSETIKTMDYDIVARHPDKSANFLFADGHVSNIPNAEELDYSENRMVWRWW